MVSQARRYDRSRLTALEVIDLTDQDYDNSDRPNICATPAAKLLPDDKENKGKQFLDSYMQFKGHGRYKLPKHVRPFDTSCPSR